MVDVNTMINIAVIVLVGFISITLMSNIANVTDCSNLDADTTTTSTLESACSSFFNNGAVLYTILAVLVLLLVIPVIRGVVGAR